MNTHNEYKLTECLNGSERTEVGLRTFTHFHSFGKRPTSMDWSIGNVNRRAPAASCCCSEGLPAVAIRVGNHDRAQCPCTRAGRANTHCTRNNRDRLKAATELTLPTA